MITPVLALSSEQVAAQYHFSTLAVQYYVSGRFATFSHCVPVAGNLLHHSIEMFLKCVLARTMTLGELKTCGHKLNVLWDKFKEIYPDPNYVSLDFSIGELNKFERLRYPDNVLIEGMQVSFTVNKADFAHLPTDPPPYHLVLEDIDCLAQTIARKSGLDSLAFRLPGSNAEANHYLQLNNNYPIQNTE
jgi:hypothetical protein